MKGRDDKEQTNPRSIQAPIYPLSGNSRNENSMNPNSPNGSNMPFHSRPVPFLGSGAIIQPTLRHSSPPGLTPIRPQSNLPPHQPWLPTSQYPRISPERPPSQIARPWTQSQMTIVQGTNQMPLQPGHMIRMPDGKLGKVIKTGQNLNQGSPNSLRNLSHNSPPRATQVQKQKTQKPAFRLHQFDFLATANQNQKKDPQNPPKKRKSEKSEKEKGKMNLPDFKRKKKPPKEEKIRSKTNSSLVQNPAPAPATVQKQKPQKAILVEEKPKEIKVRPIPNMEKIEKELLKQNKPRVDEWGPLEIVKQRKFQWPALPEGVEIVWNNSFYQPFNLTKIAVDELEKTLRESVSRDIFDVRRYIEKIIQNSNNFMADPDDKQFQQQFSFQKASKIKIWRCPNSAFIFEDDSHTLRVTVAMCRSVNEWSTKKGKLTENERKTQENGQKPSEKGPKEVVKDQIELKKESQALETGQKMQKIGEKTEEAQEIKEETSFFEENSTLSTLTDDEVPTSPLGSEPNSNAGEEPEKKRAKISKADAKEKLSTIGEIQDSPCMRYLTRQYANKKKDTFIRRGIGENYVCGVCDKLYWKDFHNFQKSHCNERSLYYDENGEFDASPDLTRNISCAFQGLRRLCPGKAVTAQTSIEQILREKRGLKPSSFTNSKIIPEWYHRLFLPSDEFREVMISPQTARHLLEILWGDIREMLLEEIEWEKSSNKDYLDGTFKQLRMRYGKNTVKRVIPGVRETCDRCKTSLFNSHYICTSCGGTICPKCAMKKIPGTDLKKIHHCSFCHNHRTIPDDRNTVLPISFIPIESFKNIYVLLQFIMSSNPSHDVPDVCHPLSTERYLKDKNVIPQELDLVGDINKSQLEELLKLEQRKIDEKMKADLLKDIEKILVDPLSDFESSDSDNDPAISPSGDELSPSDLDKINKIEQRIDSSGKVHSRFKAKVEIIDTKHFRDTPNSVIHLDGKKSKALGFITLHVGRAFCVIFTFFEIFGDNLDNFRNSQV
ncbi:Oidioi.mRNA.OKI2018_I69.chr2.g3989.t1.cds [Oikopleura dioica]|uniref:Oidioi.mRNA.OKI2018_I69.chr2.g3989.t1.cds n=1 Tax=Oikopleura dioica TaxID=34765 RepID=A0ABN7SVW6_OIKDI|nr:Oidioi.mRNA.OKI2018_I69.chr2.g3989.t1.cds [Oikopleura dioica]